MLQKPSSCGDCTLERKGIGYAPAVGPQTSKILFVGEALGEQEARAGQPFYGAAGGMLDRVLRMASLEREDFRIDNLVRCRPPRNWLDGAPWERDAVNHCTRRHLDQTLKEQHSVIVTLGGSALRHVLQLPREKGVRVENFHGTVTRDPSDRFWVVPTYHPSHLQRGAQNLIGTVVFDLMTAMEVAEGSWQFDDIALVIDPDLGWFEQWIRQYEAALARGEEVWLAVDIETPDKAKGRDEGELSTKDKSYEILRVNFACNTDEGVTVPFVGGYRTLIKRLVSSPGVKILWNAPYDCPRLAYNEMPVQGMILDFMEGWHHLQSDVPRGLGFVAPFYSRYKPWKHLAASDASTYAAIDGPQTLRCAFGIAEELQSTGMWDWFLRHCYQLRQVAWNPAEEIGVLVDQPSLRVFQEHLGVKVKELLGDIQQHIPEELKPLDPPKGLTKDIGEAGTAGTVTRKDSSGKPREIPYTVVIEHRKVMQRVCKTCGATPVVAKHKCKDEKGKPSKTLVAQVVQEELSVPRWFRRLPFNPASSQQVMQYVLYRGHKPGKDKKTKKDSVNKDTIARLLKTTRDPVYKNLATLRVVAKMKGTYVDGTFRRLESDPRSIRDGRLHTQVTNKPSTLRTSSVNPNLQNVSARSSIDGEDLAAGFRRSIIASPGCVFYELDYSGIEAVETGWCSGSPSYIRLAKLSVHALVASYLIGKPADLKWSDAELDEYFKEIKKKYNKEYNQAKRCVHGKNYGLTVMGMVKQFPEEFPTKAVAEKVENIYFSIAPDLKKWQQTVRDLAHKQHYLGGSSGLNGNIPHPFGYRHKFYSVYIYKPITRAQYELLKQKGYPVYASGGRYYKVDWGEDAKRCVAFFPQSIAAGVIKETMLRLLTPGAESYIGDKYYGGKSPFRLLIHDSLLLEVPEEYEDFVLERTAKEMLRPIVQQPCPEDWGIGSHLQIGIEIKRGKNWADMEKVPTPKFAELGVQDYSPLGMHDYLNPEVEGEEEEDEDQLLSSVLGMPLDEATL